MNSHEKLELSKETLRCLTTDLPSERLMDVQGGGDASQGTCISCLQCVVDKLISPTLIETGCWQPR